MPTIIQLQRQKESVKRFLKKVRETLTKRIQPKIKISIISKKYPTLVQNLLIPTFTLDYKKLQQGMQEFILVTLGLKMSTSKLQMTRLSRENNKKIVLLNTNQKKNLTVTKWKKPLNQKYLSTKSSKEIKY